MTNDEVQEHACKHKKDHLPKAVAIHSCLNALKFRKFYWKVEGHTNARKFQQQFFSVLLRKG